MDEPDLKTRFVDYLRHELGRADGTIRVYVDRLRSIESDLDLAADKISPGDLRAWKRRALEAHSTSHVKGVIVAVRQFHLWGSLEGLWPQNGVALVRTPKEHNRDIPPLLAEKAGALLESAQGALETRLVYLGLYAGLRVGESASIRQEHWEDGWLRFRGSKTGRVREIPIHPELESMRRVIFWYDPKSGESLQTAKKRRLQPRVGFDFVTHQLRKTFASTLYDEGVDDRIVKDLLGHAPDVTARYVVVSRRRKQEAIDLLRYPHSEPTHGSIEPPKWAKQAESTVDLEEIGPGVWQFERPNRSQMKGVKR